MRQREVLLLALVLVLASMPALALPTPPSGPFIARAPIVIASDADFTSQNGVVSGSGLPGDPYVISGWSITTSGVAIKIRNVTKEFVVRENSIDAGVGVEFSQSVSFGVVANNQFLIRGTGVVVANADAHVRDNSFIGQPGTGGYSAKGVELTQSNSRVESNAFLYLSLGVGAERGSPSIVCNDMHDDVIVSGILVRYTTNATIECNIITQCTTAIASIGAIGTVIVNNSISSCYYGIDVDLTKDVTVANNTVRFSLHTQVSIDTTSGNVTGNVVIDGRADAMIIVRSPVLVANNTITANAGIGIRVQTSGADVHANVVAKNSVGITLEGGAIARLTANVVSNNTVGLDIPYASRQAIVNMSANIVNGVNVDGTLDASQQVYFYKAANVTIVGQVRDSGFSAGFFGSLTAQGGVVLYEVDTVNINASVISHHNVGVGIVNSFNVNVNGSLLVSNLIGVKAQVMVGSGQVPNCVVSVKDTNITIPVDPIATAGVEVSGCLAILGNITVSIVDVGVKVDAQASLTMFNSTVVNTRIGLDAQGAPNGVNVSASAFVGNRVGARFSGTVGVVADSRFEGNAEVGVRLERGANLAFLRNNVTLNGAGLVDAQVCGGAHSCSSLSARANVFAENRGDGARVNGASSWRGDVAIGNEGDGFELGSSARLDAVVAAGNEGDGARIQGTFHVEDSLFTGNSEDGLDITGGGELRDSNFTFNERAGIRVSATYVYALRLNVSRNFDGIQAGEGAPNPNVWTIPPPSLPGLLPILWNGGADDVSSPLDIHRSIFLGNERDAIRTGLALVNATHNYFGRAEGPSINVADQVGAFSNGVSPTVRFVPYYTDPAMTTTGPLHML